MSSWQRETRKDLLGKTILFLISPVFSFFYSFNRANTRSSYLVFFLTGALFGMAFTIDSNGTTDTNHIDSMYYKMIFEKYTNFTYYEFKEVLTSYLSFETGKKDIFFDILAFYISRISDNYHFLFMVIAIIFSYFCLKSFRFFSSHPNFNNSTIILILTYLFFYIQLFNINGARFWLAAWIGIYCILQINIKRNNRYYLIMLLLPLIHGSYTLFLAVILLTSLFKHFDKIWSKLFYISIVFSNLATAFVLYIGGNFSAYLPTFVQKYINIYADPGAVSQWTGFGWIPELFQLLQLLYLNLLTFILIRSSYAIKSNPKTKNLYLFLLVWITVFNFLSSIPSAGRYLALCYPLVTYIWLANIQNIKYNKVIFLAPIVYSWSIFIYIGRYNLVLDPLFYFSNPFYLVYKHLLSV